MLRWGILGTGFISHAVIQAIALSDGSRVTAIAGRNPQSLREFEDKYAIPRSYMDPVKLIEDPQVDIVYIALPNHVHHTMTKIAAANGKAVLSEKSLTTTISQALELLDSVNKNKTFFVEGLMYLAHPLYQRFVELIKDGRLGDLKSISASYCADIWDVVNPASKGTLFNLGCYPASLLHLIVQTMCGDPAFASRQLVGLGNFSEKDGNICDASASVRFDNGVLANLYSSDSYGMTHACTITGEHGVLEFISNPWLPMAGRNHIQWRGYDGSTQDIIVDDPHDAFYYQIKMIETAIDNNQLEASRPSPRLADSLQIMQFLSDWEQSIVAPRQI